MTVSILGEGSPEVRKKPVRCIALFSMLLVWQRWEQKSSGSGHFDQLTTGGRPEYHLVMISLINLVMILNVIPGNALSPTTT